MGGLATPNPPSLRPIIHHPVNHTLPFTGLLPRCPDCFCGSGRVTQKTWYTNMQIKQWDGYRKWHLLQARLQIHVYTAHTHTWGRSYWAAGLQGRGRSLQNAWSGIRSAARLQNRRGRLTGSDGETNRKRRHSCESCIAYRKIAVQQVLGEESSWAGPLRPWQLYGFDWWRRRGGSWWGFPASCWSQTHRQHQSVNQVAPISITIITMIIIREVWYYRPTDTIDQ